MIKIEINEAERVYDNVREIEENWIAQQVNRRRDDGVQVCVRVKVEQEGANLYLSTPACSRGMSVGYRPPNGHEIAIIELWKHRDLNDDNFTGGNIIAFFKHLRNILN